MDPRSKTSKKQAWEPFIGVNVAVVSVKSTQKTERRFKSLFLLSKGIFRRSTQF